MHLYFYQRLNLLLNNCIDFCINGAVFGFTFDIEPFEALVSRRITTVEVEAVCPLPLDEAAPCLAGTWLLIVLVITVDDEIARCPPPGSCSLTTLAWRAGIAFFSCFLIRLAIFSILWSRSRSHLANKSRQVSPCLGSLPSKWRAQWVFQGSSDWSSSSNCYWVSS